MSDTPSHLTPQEQARIRRERRQAKLHDGANSRLNRIMVTQGSDFRAAAAAAAELEEKNRTMTTTTTTTTTTKTARAPTPTPTPTPEPEPEEAHADPPEIDISPLPAPPPSRRAQPPRRTSTHAASFAPPTSPEDEFRQAMMMDQLFGGGGAETQQEPLQQLLRQMTGGGGGLPGMEGVESMVNGMMAGGGAGGAIGPPPKRKDRWSIWWTLVHALGALLLSLWALSSNPHVFSGTQMARVESAALEKSEKPQLFWYFAMMELFLQTGRFLLEKGRPPQGSWLTTIAGFLPPPFNMYLGTVARYSVFLWTILADAGVVIFALGLASWWNS